MKTRNKYVLLLIPILCSLLAFIGCDQNNSSLLEPDQVDLVMLQNQSDLEFISLDFDQNDLAKPGQPIVISTTVTPNAGGLLKRVIDGDRRDNDRFAGMWGKVTLDFLPGAVDERVDVSFKIMRGFFMGFVEIEYAPHGLYFNKPAILNIRGRNLDLSGIDPDRLDQIKLYYTSQVNSVWVEMQCKEIFIDIENGIFRVVDGKLPHFSRYAVAYSD